MRDHFSKQLRDTNRVTEKLLPKLQGRSLSSEYQVGDEILWFMIQEKTSESKATLTVTTVVERELDLLEKDFEFVRMENTFPVFERRKNEKSSN